MNKYPLSWKVQRLGKVFPKVVVGYVGNVNDYYCSEKEGVPFYRTLNIRNGYFRHIDLKHVTQLFNDKNKKSQIKNNDILIARVGANLGMVCKVTGLNSVANIANAIIIKSSLIKDADIDFFTYFLLSPLGQKQIFAGAAGGAQGVFNTKLTQEIKVPVPPLPEQQKIAKILSTWDKAIGTTERLIDNSTQQKKALMQQLLTSKKRLLDDAGKRFTGDWECTKLEGIVIKTQLGTSERTKDVEEASTISLIKMGNLTWGGFSFDKLETLPKSKMDESLILKSGDFLFNTRNTPELVGKSAVWKEQQVEATFDNNINRITFNQNINTDFMCLYLTYGKGKSLISSLSAGSTSVAAIYWKDLKNIKLPVPTLLEQQKIATVLTNADQEIDLLKQQLADLQQEKKALMQVLLTGKRRVVVGCDTDDNEG